MSTVQTFDREAWEERERGDLVNQIVELERRPLRDRQAARTDWCESMARDPDLVCERAEWLFQGAYGWAAQQRAIGIASNRRLNQTAALGQLLAALEWECPQREAAQAWHQLTADEQQTITAALAAVIAEYPTSEATS